MKRFGDRPGRVLDAIVIVLTVPTVAICATLGLREYDIAQDHALEGYRKALARCDGMSGAVRLACRTDARAARRSVGTDATPTDGALTRSTDVADALARAQCDVLTGHAADACAGTGGSDRVMPRAQPVAQVVADRAVRKESPVGERKAAP